MSFLSKAQARLFYAAANKPGGIKGLSQDTAKKYVKDTKGQKVSKLPEYKTGFKKLKKVMGL